jgi:hypothetical protein
MHDMEAKKMQGRRLSTRKKLAFAAATALLTYAVAEIACTAIMPRPPGSIGSDSFAIQEDTGGFCIDLIRGYSITKQPARVARVSNGILEYVGTFRGNSQGFQGDRDFSVKKAAGVKSRTLVFGDSFTSAAFLEHRWTNRVEKATPNSEFVNCGIDGAGLANWWSVLSRMIVPRGYEFDRVVFAAIPNDLDRSFVVADHRCEGVVTLGYAGWDPEKFPRNLQQAFGYMRVATFAKVTTNDFDASVAQRRLVRGNFDHRVQPWIAYRVSSFFQGVGRRPPDDVESEDAPIPRLPKVSGNEYFGGDQMAMILDLRDRLAARGWKVVVVHIPARDELLGGLDWTTKLRDFARLLNARFIDGGKPFRKLSRKEILSSYFAVDGHWDQHGSDRFATYVAEQLKD